FADAFRQQVPGSDVGLSYAGGPGGLRTDIPAGPVTIGAAYDVFPFDNLVVRRTLTGAELRQLLTTQMQPRRVRFGGRSLGVSGIRVQLTCRNGAYQADVERTSGQPIRGDERLTVAMSDFLATRASALAPAAAEPHRAEPLLQMRDVVSAWLRRRGTSVQASAFADPARPRWSQPPTCGPI
ncbi:MAG: 5'-nucleotidase, partial [Acidobacteriota bacterium]